MTIKMSTFKRAGCQLYTSNKGGLLKLYKETNGDLCDRCEYLKTCSASKEVRKRSRLIERLTK